MPPFAMVLGRAIVAFCPLLTLASADGFLQARIAAKARRLYTQSDQIVAGVFSDMETMKGAEIFAIVYTGSFVIFFFVVVGLMTCVPDEWDDYDCDNDSDDSDWDIQSHKSGKSGKSGKSSKSKASLKKSPSDARQVVLQRMLPEETGSSYAYVPVNPAPPLTNEPVTIAPSSFSATSSFPRLASFQQSAYSYPGSVI
jgi:hypothetical protein